jgi:hypothetical protein
MEIDSGSNLAPHRNISPSSTSMLSGTREHVDIRSRKYVHFSGKVVSVSLNTMRRAQLPRKRSY